MKKHIIRVLTFVCGLYFFLEFFLPEEIGGNFDKEAVRTPSAIVLEESGEPRLYYVGEFDLRNEAVGLATQTEKGDFEKSKNNPVLKSTLFNSVDRLGFEAISVIKSSQKYLMFYIGLDPDRNKSICWAESEDGVQWRKHNRVIFEYTPPPDAETGSDLPWRQAYEIDESAARHRYGKLQTITAFDDNGTPGLLIAVMVPGGKTVIWTARGKSSGDELVLDPSPLQLEDELALDSIKSMSVVRTDASTEAWLVLSNGKLYRTPIDPALDMKEVEFPLAEEGTLSELSAVPVDNGLQAYYTIRNADGNLIEGLFASETSDGETWTALNSSTALVKKGEEGTPTYLSKATDFASESLGIIGAFAIFLGVINMCMVHGKNITRTRKQTYNSVIFFVFLVTMFIFTLWGKPASEKLDSEKTAILSTRATNYRGEGDALLGDLETATENVPKLAASDLASTSTDPVLAPFLIARTVYNQSALERMKQENPAKARILYKKARSVKHYGRKDAQKAVETGEEIAGMAPQEGFAVYSGSRVVESKGYNFIFQFFLQSLGTSVFALISFYMVGAAFRSFRVKSAEALLLILSAVIVLLGQIPIGNLLLPHSLLPKTGQKLLLIVNAAAYRGVVLGMMVGGLSMALRLWLGLERGMFHGTD